MLAVLRKLACRMGIDVCGECEACASKALESSFTPGASLPSECDDVREKSEKRKSKLDSALDKLDGAIDDHDQASKTFQRTSLTLIRQNGTKPRAGSDRSV